MLSTPHFSEIFRPNFYPWGRFSGTPDLSVFSRFSRVLARYPPGPPKTSQNLPNPPPKSTPGNDVFSSKIAGFQGTPQTPPKPLKTTLPDPWSWRVLATWSPGSGVRTPRPLGRLGSGPPGHHQDPLDPLTWPPPDPPPDEVSGSPTLRLPQLHAMIALNSPPDLDFSTSWR